MFNKEALEQIREELLRGGETIAVAESVSAGFLQAPFSRVPDAAKFFQGGITAFNLGQKYRHLLVNPIHAQDCNCVSGEVAVTMALEVCKLFSSHWGIGITGYATKLPEGGNELHVYYAVVYKGEVLEENIIRASSEERGRDTASFCERSIGGIAKLHESGKDETRKGVRKAIAPL